MNPDKASVQPEWCRALPLQQQSVLFLAARGPDGIPKSHPCKDVQRAYRATVLVAAKFGRLLKWGDSLGGERGDSFMCLEKFADDREWLKIVETFYREIDSLPLHFVMHLIHGAEILGYKHPDIRFRRRWLAFYHTGVEAFHLSPETEEQMDARLCDWKREHWDDC